jgi:transcriptional regulator GlxA family with amidase domain
MREEMPYDGLTSHVGVAAGAGFGRRAPWGVSLSLTVGVARAESAINALPEAPHTTESLARSAGLSARSLSRGFQQLRGYSPMTALRHTRLERVRRDLMRGAAGGTVTEAAVRWGFLHLGRFSSLYAARFGELPSVTRRRAVAEGHTYRYPSHSDSPVSAAS